MAQTVQCRTKADVTGGWTHLQFESSGNDKDFNLLAAHAG